MVYYIYAVPVLTQDATKGWNYNDTKIFVLLLHQTGFSFPAFSAKISRSKDFKGLIGTHVELDVNAREQLKWANWKTTLVLSF